MNENTPSTYAFELSNEAKRLEEQNRFAFTFTRRMLDTIEIKPGMRVLDMGSGGGDMALMLAERVGAQGEVIGIDQNAAILTIARERARAAGFANVTFIDGNLFDISLDSDFDAIVGRFVLMHIQDSAALLRRLLPRLRSGGIVAFQDGDFIQHIVTQPPMPLFNQVEGWIVDAFKRAGAETEMGMKLHKIFMDAGLPSPEMDMFTQVGCRGDWGGYNHLAGLVRGLLPVITRFNIATEEQIEIDTLAQRLRQEVVSRNGVVIGLSVVNAWTRKP